jgi:hypothetical protein
VTGISPRMPCFLSFFASYVKLLLATCLAFDANDRHLASGGADQLVEVWDLTRIRAELDRLGLGW